MYWCQVRTGQYNFPASKGRTRMAGREAKVLFLCQTRLCSWASDSQPSPEEPQSPTEQTLMDPWLPPARSPRETSHPDVSTLPALVFSSPASAPPVMAVDVSCTVLGGVDPNITLNVYRTRAEDEKRQLRSLCLKSIQQSLTCWGWQPTG